VTPVWPIPFENSTELTEYYRFAYTPEDRNYWNMSISGGIGARGVINGRPLDRMGVGLYWMKSSGDLNGEPIINGILQNETGVEAYYNFAITPWLQISADLQYVNSGLSVLT
jgi:porin